MDSGSNINTNNNNMSLLRFDHNYSIRKTPIVCVYIHTQMHVLVTQRRSVGVWRR